MPLFIRDGVYIRDCTGMVCTSKYIRDSVCIKDCTAILSKVYKPTLLFPTGLIKEKIGNVW